MIAKGEYTVVDFNGSTVQIARNALGIKNTKEIPVTELMSIGWVEPSFFVMGQFRLHQKGDNSAIGAGHPNCVLFKPNQVE